MRYFLPQHLIKFVNHINFISHLIAGKLPEGYIYKPDFHELEEFTKLEAMLEDKEDTPPPLNRMERLSHMFKGDLQKIENLQKQKKKSLNDDEPTAPSPMTMQKKLRRYTLSRSESVAVNKAVSQSL